MAAVDESIRADFLVEAGDLVEQLGSQLVALESQPGDTALINAIFRAFHTVKGGAGFLQLDPLVAICHAAEDVFNLVRSGRCAVDAGLMDLIQQALDQVQLMLGQVSASQALSAAPPALLAQLHARARNTAAPTAEARPKPAAAPVAATPASDTITEDEFDQLLDSLAAQKKPAPPPSNTITEDEFEALLDARDAAKRAEKAPAPVAAPAAAAAPAPVPAPPRAAAPVPESSVRVETRKLDQMMNLVGELVLVRNRMKTLRLQAGEAMAQSVGQLDHITRALQAAVMQTRMQPVGKVFARFPKLARDTARALGKQVEVHLRGQETDLDKNLVEALADPLVHMVRNSVDHGIESPEMRTKAGKPVCGRIELAAEQAGDHILITVRDDGAGMDPARLREKAVQKGLLNAEAAAQLRDEDALQLIFAAGFSTKEQVSDLSGRGVGMDVVKTAIQSLNGEVRVESRPGQGSTIHIRVPLTLAILPALMVIVGDRQFALPLGAVEDVFALDRSRLRRMNQWQVLPVEGGGVLRVVDLHGWVGDAPGAEACAHVVTVRHGGAHYGLIVSQVRGREEIVIKPLGGRLRGLCGISGATVTPEGRVALILDVAGLVQTGTQATVPMEG